MRVSRGTPGGFWPFLGGSLAASWPQPQGCYSFGVSKRVPRERFKGAQERPKSGPRAPKTAQETPKRVPREPSDRQKGIPRAHQEENSDFPKM